MGTSLSSDTAARAGGVAKTSTHRYSSAQLPSDKSNQQRHDLSGVGAHSFNGGSNDYDTRMPYSKKGLMCPYHNTTVEARLARPSQSQGLSPMDRYLAERRSDRYSILAQANRASTLAPAACTCPDVTKDNLGGNKHV